MAKSIARSKVKAYWRSKLYQLLRMPTILQSIIIGKGGHIDFTECDWRTYWKDCILTGKNSDALEVLHFHWQKFIESGFHSEFADSYCSSFFELLNLAFEADNRELIAKLLSFESFRVLNEGDPMPFVAMTSNFRHPIFLLLTARGIRRDDKLDSRLLPILTLEDKGKPHQFYCLTKDKFGRGNNHNLIVFLNTGPKDRSICFNALQPLVGILTDEWGEFVNKRASRIAEKVILPLLEKSPEVVEDNLLKVLDVGSGVGMVLSNVVRCMAASSPNMPNIQARLLDRIAMDPKVQFTSDQVMKHITSIEYIKTDYKTWLDQFTAPYEESYNITFIYRLLHTMSDFRILPEPPPEDTGQVTKEYSDYFRAAYYFCGKHRLEKDGDRVIYIPKRIFNLASLETASGKSIIEKCVGMSTWTIVEDLDLDPKSLIEHLIRHNLYSNMLVYDLSQAMQLRTNYIYCLCNSKKHAPEIGRLIWPN